MNRPISGLTLVLFGGLLAWGSLTALVRGELGDWTAYYFALSGAFGALLVILGVLILLGLTKDKPYSVVLGLTFVDGGCLLAVLYLGIIETGGVGGLEPPLGFLISASFHLMAALCVVYGFARLVAALRTI